MATYSTNEFKSGLKIMINGDPHNIVENEFVKPGKGQAFNRVKVRNLLTGRVVEKTFKSGESVEAADVFETQAQYLYNDGEFWHFMHGESYEQYAMSKEAVGDAVYWMQEESICDLTLFNGEPISVLPPNFVEMPHHHADSLCCGAGGGVRGAYAKNSIAMARLRLKEVEQVGADILLTECNSCVHNLSNAKLRAQRFKIYTITQFINQAMAQEKG